VGGGGCGQKCLSILRGGGSRGYGLRGSFLIQDISCAGWRKSEASIEGEKEVGNDFCPVGGKRKTPCREEIGATESFRRVMRLKGRKSSEKYSQIFQLPVHSRPRRGSQEREKKYGLRRKTDCSSGKKGKVLKKEKGGILSLARKVSSPPGSKKGSELIINWWCIL